MRTAATTAVIAAALGVVCLAQSLPLQPAVQPGKPAPQSGDVRTGTVAVSGDNHIINLSATGKDSNTTRISFWRVVYSPVGMGHVCYVRADLTGDGPSKDDVTMAFTDNEQLVGYLSAEIMPMLDSSFHGEPMHWTKATFAESGDTKTSWKETITAGKTAIELVWRDFLSPFLIDKPMGDPKMPYGIVSMFLPAKSADVIINGTRVAGAPYARLRGTTPSSSAFLAFSETWLR